MIHRLDRYVARSVLGSCTATLLFVVTVFVIFDLLLNMNRYLWLINEKGFSLLEVLQTWGEFHLVSLPWLFVALAPFVIVIGSMFSISRFMAANEITPMLFTGRSTVRVVAPCLAMAVISAGTMAAIWETVLPSTSRKMQLLEDTLVEGESSNVLESIALYSDDQKERLMLRRFYPELQRMEGIVVVGGGFAEDEPAYMVQANAAVWDPEQADWELQQGRTHEGRVVKPRGWLGMKGRWLGTKGITPEILWLAGRDADSSTLLSYTELLQLTKLSPQRHDLVIAMHYHLTWPLANLILLMLALPFAVRFERGGKLGRIVLAIAICAGYLIVDLTCQNLGRGEFIHPILAAWTPPILFGSLGMVMFGGMRT